MGGGEQRIGGRSMHVHCSNEKKEAEALRVTRLHVDAVEVHPTKANSQHRSHKIDKLYRKWSSLGTRTTTKLQQPDSSDTSSVSISSHGCMNREADHRRPLHAAASNSGPHRKVTSKDPKEEQAFVRVKSLARGWFNPEKGIISLDHGGTVHKKQVVETEKVSQVPLALSPFPSGKIISAYRILKEAKMEKVGKVMGTLLESHSHYYDDPERLAFLEAGGVFFSFTCRTWLEPYERDMVEAIANLSSFENEAKENFVPDFDVSDPSDLRMYTFILQKSAYLLPGVQLKLLTPELLSSVRYHRECQPKGTRIWEDVREESTFRMTKPIVRYIYNMTIQFKVSRIDQADLKELGKLMGLRVDCGILMERTKRSKVPKPDFTAKAKSVLLYTAVPGGVLVTHSTVILNNSIPVVVAKIIDSLGSMGLGETIETAERTREHLLAIAVSNPMLPGLEKTMLH